MNWLLLIVEIALALAVFHFLDRNDAFKRQSRGMRFLVMAVILFVLFMIARLLLPGVAVL